MVSEQPFGVVHEFVCSLFSHAETSGDRADFLKINSPVTYGVSWSKTDQSAWLFLASSSRSHLTPVEEYSQLPPLPKKGSR